MHRSFKITDYIQEIAIPPSPKGKSENLKLGTIQRDNMLKLNLSLSGRFLYSINYEITTWREEEKKKK